MTRKKKKPAPVKETLAPGIERITFGDWISKGSRLEITIPTAAADDIKNFGLNNWKGDFGATLDGIEREAKRVLENAGLPIDAQNPYNIPAGKFHGCVIPLASNGDQPLQDIMKTAAKGLTKGLVQIVEKLGKYERVDPEWYAAKILWTLSAIRFHMRQEFIDQEIPDYIAQARPDIKQTIRQDKITILVAMSYSLGELVTEAKALGFFKQTGAEGPPKRKQQKSPYSVLTRYLLRNYPDGPDVTDEHRFDMVPEIRDDGETIGRYKVHRRSGQESVDPGELILGRYRFHRKAGRIHAEERVGPKDSGTWKPVGKPLKLSAFRKHMTKERKRITR
jgi:hypothetical protein